MCTADPSTLMHLSSVPQLDRDDLLLLLQSFLYHQSGKYRPQRPLWLANEDFARLDWQSYGCTPEESAAVHASYCAMLGITPPAVFFSLSFAQIVAEAYNLWTQQGRTITFSTSGSTGKPKACIHSEDFLRQEVAGLLPLLTHLPPRARALVTVPLHHLYGFTYGLMMPRALGLPLQIEAPLPTAIAHQMRPRDLVVGIPLLWTKLADLRHLPCTDAVLLSSTAPLPDATLDQLCGRGFQCVEIFGSSETGAMGFRKRGHTPFSLLAHFTRFTDGASSVVRRQLPNGTLWTVPLQDDHIWPDERHFIPQGRKDYAVQVGGVNVYPVHVEKVLASHPYVRACAVRLMRPDEGQRLKAFVVPVDGCSPQELRKQLRAFSKEHLTEEERPAIFTIGKELPRNSMGKLTDWRQENKAGQKA